MTAKRYLLTFASFTSFTIFATFAGIARADQALEKADAFSLGWNVSSFSNNYGLGIGVSSPHFNNGTLHFQLSGDYAWAQGVPAGGAQTTWAPYGLIKLGFFGGRFLEGLPIRFYGGGGPLLILASSALSSQASQIGGFGLVGFEFYFRPQRTQSVYFELGGLGSGAKADQMVSSPIYANGFMISWGFNYYL